MFKTLYYKFYGFVKNENYQIGLCAFFTSSMFYNLYIIRGMLKNILNKSEKNKLLDIYRYSVLLGVAISTTIFYKNIFEYQKQHEQKLINVYSALYEFGELNTSVNSKIVAITKFI